jgi:hypothetical protein
MFGIAPGAEELIPQPQGLAAVQHWFMPWKDSQFLVNFLARTTSPAQSCIISKSRYSNIRDSYYL